MKKSQEIEMSATPKDSGWIPALIGGIAGALAFEPVSLRFLIPLAPLGLFLAVQHSATPKRAFMRVMGGGFIFHMSAIFWLCTLYHFNPFAPPSIAFVAFYMAFFPAISGYAIKRWLSESSLAAQFFAWGALWIVSEWFRTLGRLSMPFTEIGHAWATWPWAIQWADFGGELSVSALILLFSASLIPLFAKISGASQREESKLPYYFAFVCGGLLLASSALRLRMWDSYLAKTPDDQKLRVAVIQPNIDQMRKMTSASPYPSDDRDLLREEGFTIHANLVVNEVPDDADLIVMPESTFASLDFAYDEILHDRIQRLMSSRKSDLFFGADRVVLDAEGDIAELYNSGWFLPRGKTMREAGWQDKMRLVPFGEDVPYVGVIPFVQSMVGIENFNYGTEIHLFETRGRKFGGMICFESTMGLQARKIVNAGAEFLSIITNDAWYRWSAWDGPHWSSGPKRHHDLSILRAVETRRPIVRAANTGISSLIAPSGRVEASLELDRRAALTGAISPQNTKTIYTRLGNWPLILCCVGGLIAIGIKRNGRLHFLS